MRSLLPGAALPWALVWVLAAAPVAGAPAGAILSSDIPPQSLGAALEAFGESTGLSVHWPPETDTLPSPGARAGLSLEKALRQSPARRVSHSRPRLPSSATRSPGSSAFRAC